MTTATVPVFEVGQEYLGLGLKTFKIKIVKRTPKTITFTSEANGEASPFGAETKKVKIINGSEYFNDGIAQYYADQTK